MTEDSCKTCRFFSETDTKWGLCRRYPPSTSFARPTVSVNTWCGEFQPVEITDQDFEVKAPVMHASSESLKALCGADYVGTETCHLSVVEANELVTCPDCRAKMRELWA